MLCVSAAEVILLAITFGNDTCQLATWQLISDHVDTMRQPPNDHLATAVDHAVTMWQSPDNYVILVRSREIFHQNEMVL